MRIDAHVHFWQPACGFDNRPIANHAAYRRDFLPEHVEADLAQAAIDGIVLVQTCPQVEETAWLLSLARERGKRASHAAILGITGWVDLDRPHIDFDALVAEPVITGIRAQLRRTDDPMFIRRPHVLRNLGAALDAGLGVTILAEARHYAHLGLALEALPAGPVTINHLGLRFPDVDAGAWRDAMRVVARRDQTFVQLSGLPFLFGERWREREALAVLDEALDLLGPRRLMFASDWPMLVRFASYGEWVRTVEDFVQRRGLTTEEGGAVFAGNALRANPRLRVPGNTRAVSVSPA